MFDKVGVIGLGRMGMAMAERLTETGLTVVGTDIFEQTRQAATANGIQTVATAADVFAQVDVIILSLPTAKDVELVLQPLLARTPGKALYVIDTTSSDPRVTQRLEAALEPVGVYLLDAPVSGGFFGARAGTLGIMVGGSEEHLTSVKEVLDKLAGKLVYMGPSGSGHSTKLLNNLLGAANMVVTSEIVQLGVNVGLNPERLIAILSAGGARNSATEINYPRWILNGKFDSGFTMKLMRKDVGLADQLVNARGDLPLLANVAAIWAESGGTVGDQADFNRITEFHPSKASSS